MSRAIVRPRNKAKWLGVMAWCAVVTLGGASTIAVFTSTATSSVTVAAGSINLTANSTAATTLDYGIGWIPGKTVSKTVIIKNNGTLPLKYTFAPTGTIGPLAPRLDATAKIATPAATLYTGKLNVMKSAAARTLAAGASESIVIALTWTAGADDNTFMDAKGNMSLLFSATL